MISRIRSRSLCSRLSRQGFPCSWGGLGAVLLFVMAYPPVAEPSSKEIPVLFSTTSQEHTPFTFLQESGQNPFSLRSHGIFCLSRRFVFLVDLPKAFDPPQTDLTAGQQPEQQPQRRRFTRLRALRFHPAAEFQLQPLDGVGGAQREPLARP